MNDMRYSPQGARSVEQQPSYAAGNDHADGIELEAACTDKGDDKEQAAHDE